MNFITLAEISTLIDVRSYEHLVYIPFHDERVIMRTILDVNHSHVTNFRYEINTFIGDKWRYGFCPALTHYQTGYKCLIQRQTSIDQGIVNNDLHQNTWLNRADYIFTLGERYGQLYLKYLSQYLLPPLQAAKMEHSVTIDSSGYKLGNYCAENSVYFLHPDSMIGAGMTAQVFITYFNHCYNTPFKWTGIVYEQKGRPWAFIESSQATLGQVFFLGVSWFLNRPRIESLLATFCEDDLASFERSPEWFAYETDFPLKWPWSTEYIGRNH